MEILVIVPAHNEQDNIEEVINDIKKADINLNVLVINDGSYDNTALIAERTQKADVINLSNNLGIGGAVQTGFKYAQRNNYDVVLRIDGDGQHQAGEIPKIIKPVLNNEADVVIGSRFLGGDKPYPVFIRRLGQKIISFLTSLISGQKITDSTSGFRCYNKKSIFLLNRYYSTDYPEPEEIIFLKKNKFKIKEVGVLMKNREKGNSSITVVKYFYYVIKVALSLFISILRTPVIKEK